MMQASNLFDFVLHGSSGLSSGCEMASWRIEKGREGLEGLGMTCMYACWCFFFDFTLFVGM